MQVIEEIAENVKKLWSRIDDCILDVYFIQFIELSVTLKAIFVRHDSLVNPWECLQ